jgi:predicted HTH transcriptional regulator
MLTLEKILTMIKSGEGLCVEFKRRFSSYEKVAKEIIAFANTRGGFILFGVDDNKSIYGIESEKADIELINDAALKYSEPPIQIKLFSFDINHKEILVVEVPESKIKPHRIQDYKTNIDLNAAQVYVRVNDKSVLSSKELIKLMQTKTTDKSLVNYIVGKQEKVVFDYLDKNETIMVKELSKLANISERRASRTLIKLVRANLLLIHQKDNGESYFTYVGN